MGGPVARACGPPQPFDHGMGGRRLVGHRGRETHALAERRPRRGDGGAGPRGAGRSESCGNREGPRAVVAGQRDNTLVAGATVEWPFDPDTVVREVLAMGPDHIGERLADVFLETWEQDGRPRTALTLLHAACERPEAASLMRELFTTCVVDPIVAALAPERAELRASLVAGHLLGLHVGRYLLAFDAIAGADPDVLKRALASTIQHMCTGPLW